MNINQSNYDIHQPQRPLFDIFSPHHDVYLMSWLCAGLTADTPKLRSVLLRLIWQNVCFRGGKERQLQWRTGGGVAVVFRNSIHCSTPTRAENTSVERRANQRPPSSCEPRPQAYIKGSAVRSAGHWHNNRLLPANRGEGVTLSNLSFQPSFIFLN